MEYSLMPRPYSVSSALLATFEVLGVQQVSTVPGAQIAHFLKELDQHQHIAPIAAIHELGAAYIACGCARASGTVGVVASIGGPGAAYMLAAAQAAQANQLPVCFITGDIPANAHGRGEFQDTGPLGTNDLKIFEEAIGNSILCGGPQDLPKVFQEIRASLKERRPLHIKLPIDVQMMPCHFVPEIAEPNALPSNAGKDRHPFDAIQRAVIFVGAGIMDLIDPAQLREYVKTLKIGVVTDYGARGILPEDALESLGMVGFRSDPRALLALRGAEETRAEKVICVGVPEISIHRYIGNGIEKEVLSVDDFYGMLATGSLSGLSTDCHDQRRLWLLQLAKHRPLAEEQPLSTKGPVTFRQLFSQLTVIMPAKTRYCLDAGQVRLTGSMLFSCHEPKMVNQCEALSPMGYGLCTAIGMQLVSPDRRVVALVGDGSMRMLGMELATAMRYSLGVIIVLIDNQSYASTEHWDLGRDYIQLPVMDWSRFAASMGVDCLRASTSEEFSEALNQSAHVKGPTLIWVKIEASLDSFFTSKHELEYPTWLHDLKNSNKE